MQKFTCILFLLALIANTGFSQGISPENQVEEICECYTIVDNCTGKTIPYFPNAQPTITVYCADGGDRDFPVSTGGTVCISKSYMNSCSKPSFCFNYFNWEICSVVGCTIKVYQTLPVNIQINGSNVGNGFGSSATSGQTQCIGREYDGPLNVVANPTIVENCPGQSTILTFPNYIALPNSQSCLYVSVKKNNGTVVVPPVEYSSGNGNVFGNQFNITQIIQQLDNANYILEWELRCCNSTPNCNINTKFWLYISVVGKVKYTPWYIGGIEPNSIQGSPSKTLPGSLLPNNNGQTALTFIGLDPYYRNNTTINWYLNKVNCSNGDYVSHISSGTMLLDPTMITSGTIQFPSSSGCECYKLVVTYDNGCDPSNTTETYYFKSGTGCFTDNDNSAESRSFFDSETESRSFKLAQNPPINQNLVFELSGKPLEESTTLFVFDASGRQVVTQRIPPSEGVINMPFEQPQGIYFYLIRIDGKVFNGKILNH